MRVGVRCEIIKNDIERLRKIIESELLQHKTPRSKLGLAELDEKRIADEYIESAKKLSDFICDTVYYLNKEIKKPKPSRVLAEGAQAFLLDIDHGMYPFTTSSSTTSGAVAIGLGIPPVEVKRVIGVSKAIQSHVGGGTFVTEIKDETLLKKLHGDMGTVDAEYGTTTGRIRRLGHLDLPGIRRSQMVNGTHEIALTKLDWVSRYNKIVPICTGYEINGDIQEIAPDSAYLLSKAKPVYEELPIWSENIQDVRNFDELPKEAQAYIEFIEEKTGTPVTLIGVGPNREQVIIRGNI